MESLRITAGALASEPARFFGVMLTMILNFFAASTAAEMLFFHRPPGGSLLMSFNIKGSINLFSPLSGIASFLCNRAAFRSGQFVRIIFLQDLKEVWYQRIYKEVAS